MLDIWLPGMDGLATLAKLQERRVDAPVIMISGHGNIESAVRAIKMGAFDFVEKPLSLEKTVLVVANAVRQRRLEVENRELRATVDRRHTIVGESYVLRQLLEQVAMAAPTNGRVLIYGENGTGKELVARTIHMRSRRTKGPFIEVNCAAIPEELIESELFGHMKGAFTGAVVGSPRQVRAGRRRHAVPRRDRRHEREDAGQGAARAAGAGGRAGRRHVERQGRRARDRRDEQGPDRRRSAPGASARTSTSASTSSRSSCRRCAIATTTSQLLADHFMAEFAREYGRRPKRLDTGAATGLRSYRWPGNVRELRNVIERLMIMVPGDTIALGDLAFLDGGAVAAAGSSRARRRCRCTTRASASSATTSCAPWPRRTATSPAPPTPSASSAAICIGR